MPTIVVCAQNAVTQAGLAALAAPLADSLSRRIALTHSAKIVGKTNSLLALSTWLQTQTADLALVELAMAEADSVDELAQIIEVLPPEESIPFLLMVDWVGQGNRFAQRLDRLLGTGLVSVLPMAVTVNEMQGAIAAITQGLVILHPEIAEFLFEASSFSLNESEGDDLLEPLSPREIQVLNQLASGMTNRAIAQKLLISEHTVKFHISTIFSKLDAASRTEAVTVGIRAGLVTL